MSNILKYIKISGTGSYTPERILKNSDIAKKVETSDEWIYKNLGIRERRIAKDDESTSDMAAKAAIKAIESAKLEPDDIDLIIVATASPDRLAPSTACIVQEKIKAFNAAAFDIAAVCSGFVYGMGIAAEMIAGKSCKNVLVIGADKFSIYTDWEKRNCVFFGDGAGAAVLSYYDDEDTLFCYSLSADGRGKHNFTIKAGGSQHPSSHETINNREHFFSMNGKEVFNTATAVIPVEVGKVLKRADLTIDDVDYMIPHQPSINILKVSAQKLGIPFEKVMTNMDKYANTSGATVPIILDETVKKGKIKRGDIVVFAAVGSGWTWGSIVMKWI
jgi:3-oxoacyl-[acyl-carrier-protein] synthase III